MGHIRKVLVESVKTRDIVEGMLSLPRELGDAFGVFVAGDDDTDWAPLVEALASTGRTFFGGIFPELIDGARRYRHGALILRVRLQGEPLIVEDVARPIELGQLGEISLPGDTEKPTAIVLVDGLSGGNSEFMEAIYHELGGGVRYWGGGAGSLGNPGRNCLFSNRGLFSGGAIVSICPWRAKLGVRHGWQPMAGPLVATWTKANTARELNWRTAAVVYAVELEQLLGKPVVPGELCRVAGNFPLGLQKHGDDLVVRDFLSVEEDGSVTFAGHIPENAVLTVLGGDSVALVDAARQAAVDVVPEEQDHVHVCLVADCVTRASFLGEDFVDELSAIEEVLRPCLSNLAPCGVLTIGEISSSGDGFLEFFNKTCVVAVLHE